MASGLNNLVEMTFEIPMKLFAVVTVSSIFVFPGALLLMIMGWLGRAYMKAQLAVKRERSNALSPVLGHFGAAMSGLGASFDFSQGFWRSWFIVSIRAYGVQAAFRHESYLRIDRYTRASITFTNLSR